MEKRLPNLFDWDYKRLFAFSHEDIIRTQQTDETEKVFDEKITHCFKNLIIDTPVIAKLHIANDTMNDETRYGDCTTEGYMVNNIDEFKNLIKSTSEQFVGMLKNLIKNDTGKRITSWWVINYRKFRKGGYEGTIRLSYYILSQADERGASVLYKEYKYNLSFRTIRKDFHI